MGYQLIAIDLDDTLLRDDLTISRANKRAITEAVKRNKLVIISTGRMFKSALPFAQELGLHHPIISYQGALVKTADTGQVLVERPVPLELAQEVLHIGYARGIHINVYLNDTLFVDGITEEGIGYANLARVELNPVGDLRRFLTADPTKLLFIGEPAHLDKLLTECREKFAGRLYVTKSKPHFLEFMHPQANKGGALEELGRIFGIAREEMIAVGDSYNDLDMIEYAGLGVVMGNARDEVKKVADYVTLDNEADGVAHVIEKFLLQDN